jgi:hypothetical protein
MLSAAVVMLNVTIVILSEAKDFMPVSKRFFTAFRMTKPDSSGFILRMI